MKNNYKIVQYLPIWTNGLSIFIGIPETSQYIELDKLPEIDNLIENLVKNGVTTEEIKRNIILENLLDKEIIRLENHNSRRDNFFDYLKLNFPPEVLNTNILILGAGAGGSTITYLLAQFGFNNLTICDDDIVNYSDIEKTMVFDKINVGQKKVDALQSKINNNFGILVKKLYEKPLTENDLSELFDEHQPEFIIKACDPDLSFRVALNNYCFKRKIAHLHMSYSFEMINIGPLYIPNYTCCDNSLNQLSRQSFGDGHLFENQRKLYTNFTTHPSISFNINILANFTFKEIVFYLTKNEHLCNTIGKIVYYNTSIMKGYTYKLVCSESCSFFNKNKN